MILLVVLELNPGTTAREDKGADILTETQSFILGSRYWYVYVLDPIPIGDS